MDNTKFDQDRGHDQDQNQDHDQDHDYNQDHDQANTPKLIAMDQAFQDLSRFRKRKRGLVIVVFCCGVLCCVSCLVLSCLVLCSLILSCLVLSCLVLPCLVLRCLVLCCLVYPCLGLFCPVEGPPWTRYSSSVSQPFPRLQPCLWAEHPRWNLPMVWGTQYLDLGRFVSETKRNSNLWWKNASHSTSNYLTRPRYMVLSCLVLFCLVLSCLVLLCLVLSCLVVYCLV